MGYACFPKNSNFLANIHYGYYRPEGAYSLVLFVIFTFYELSLWFFVTYPIEKTLVIWYNYKSPYLNNFIKKLEAYELFAAKNSGI